MREIVDNCRGYGHFLINYNIKIVAEYTLSYYLLCCKLMIVFLVFYYIFTFFV